MTHKLSVLASTAVLALAAGCATPTGSGVVSSTPMPTGGHTMQMGQVTHIELVDAAQRPGLGTILGAVVGAAAGNQIGSGSGRSAATIAGAVGGAVVGRELEKRQAGDVYRVTVRFDNGSTQTFHFERIDGLRTGDRVRYDGRQLYRA